MNEIQTVRTPDIIGSEIRSLTSQAKAMTLWFGIEIGRRLTEAKALLEHGQWLPYLKEQTEFSQSSASRLMTLYREYGAAQTSLFGAESNYPTLNNLSISNALRLLAVPEEEREEFAAEHDVEHMSARELDELIKAREAAEARAEQAENALRQADEGAALRAAEWQEKIDAAKSAESDAKDLLKELKVKLAAAEAASRRAAAPRPGSGRRALSPPRLPAPQRARCPPRSCFPGQREPAPGDRAAAPFPPGHGRNRACQWQKQPRIQRFFRS